MNNVDEEVLEALTNNPEGLRRKDMFLRCESAEVEIDVSHAIKRLLKGGFIVELASRHGNQGAVYGLSAPVDLSFDVDNVRVRSGIYDEAEIIQPTCNLNAHFEEDNAVLQETLTPVLDAMIKAEEVTNDSVDGDIDRIIKGLVSLKKRFSRPAMVADFDRKMQCLDRLSAIAKDDIAAILDDIAADLQGLRHD